MNPKVSVVMSVYNASPFIREAIQSILDQTFTDFEFIIFNDGSTDNSLDIIKSFNDPRIQVFSSSTNRGIAANVNEGIARSRGKYIARMDGDDISLPERLQKEFDFLENHPDFGMVGAWIENIDAKGKSIGEIWKLPGSPEEIPVTLLFSNYFAQSTLLIRKSSLPDVHYKEDFVPTEDYELWCRISDRAKVWNLQEVLVKYRVHGNNIGFLKKKKCDEMVRKILALRLSDMGVTATDDEIWLHYSLSFENPKIDDAFLEKVNNWYKKIYLANLKSSKYDKVILYKTMLGRWYIMCRKYNKEKFFTFYLLRGNKLSLIDYIRLVRVLLVRLFR